MQALRLILAACLSLAPLSSVFASEADAYPQRSVRLVIPYAPGGGVDLLGRKFAEGLAKQLGQSVYVENKVAAGGTLGATTVSLAQADGYTLLFGGAPLITNKLINPSVKVDALTSLTPVALINMSPFALTIAQDAPYKNIDDLLQAARENPGKLNFASGGIGTGAHLAGASLATLSSIDVVHVPYRGSVELVPSLLGGQTQFSFPILSVVLPQMEAGAVRVLAITSANRIPMLPDMPTLREVLQSDDAVVESWNGVWGPPGLNEGIAVKLNAAIRRTLEDPEIRKFFDDSGAPIELTASPEEFERFVRSETEKFARIVSASKIAQF